MIIWILIIGHGLGRICFVLCWFHGIDCVLMGYYCEWVVVDWSILLFFFLFLDSFISVKIMNEILKMNDYIR